MLLKQHFAEDDVTGCPVDASMITRSPTGAGSRTVAVRLTPTAAQGAFGFGSTVQPPITTAPSASVASPPQVASQTPPNSRRVSVRPSADTAAYPAPVNAFPSGASRAADGLPVPPGVT